MAALLVDPNSVPSEVPDSWLVGDAKFCRFIPLVHLALAAGEAPVPFPRLGRDDSARTVIPYWQAGLYLATYLLGWSDPGAGFKRWYELGQPTTDPRLELLQNAWNDKGQLALLALHCWRRAHHFGGPIGPDGGATMNSSERDPKEFLGEGWLRSVLEQFPGYRMPYEGGDPYHGGTNPLHLGSNYAWVQPQTSVALFDPDSRRASLTLDRFDEVYLALHQLSAKLPTLGDRSWSVDVFVRPLGWLGTFRQSRDTKLWFQGAHSIHLLGNPSVAIINTKS